MRKDCTCFQLRRILCYLIPFKKAGWKIVFEEDMPAFRHSLSLSIPYDLITSGYSRRLEIKDLLYPFVEKSKRHLQMGYTLITAQTAYNFLNDVWFLWIMYGRLEPWGPYPQDNILI